MTDYNEIRYVLLVNDTVLTLTQFTFYVYLTGGQWDNMTVFCDRVGWDIMFDLNLFYWKNGYWDPTNADLLLKYSSARGVKIPAFQLGNGKSEWN